MALESAGRYPIRTIYLFIYYFHICLFHEYKLNNTIFFFVRNIVVIRYYWFRSYDVIDMLSS